MTEVLLPNFSERPSDWEVSKRVRLYDNLPEFQDDLIEAAGPHFIGVITREAHPMSLYQDLAMRSILKDGNDDDEDRLPYFRAIDPPEILSSDPEDKNQDHYKILGLEEYRWKATLDDIKVACKIC